MTRPPPVSAPRLVAAGASLLVAAATGGLLWASARAPDQAERLNDIRARQATAAALPDPSSVKSAFPAGAVCESGLAPAVVLLRARTADAAAAAGVSISDFTASPVPAGAGALSTVRMTIQVDGPYASGLNFAKILADAAPTIFVDELDISSGPNGSARWRLSGRVFCALRLES